MQEARDYILKMINSKRVYSFYPEGMMCSFHLDDKEMNDILSSFIKKRLIKIVYEVRCSECLSVLGTFNSMKDIPNTLECVICGKEIELEQYNIYKLCVINK